jgi:hypothetical protein
MQILNTVQILVILFNITSIPLKLYLDYCKYVLGINNIQYLEKIQSVLSDMYLLMFFIFSIVSKNWFLVLISSLGFFYAIIKRVLKFKTQLQTPLKNARPLFLYDFITDR